MIFYRNGSSIVSINWKTTVYSTTQWDFFNAATAKKDDYPENILVRKGERSALAIGNKKQT
ncbi:hypothetical protein A1704_08145 [Chryseobacterium cucumeris]|nr:hypothetical protein A1704_08145 [Chryseobacterium cucumeris]RKE78740.1 hypothetical protein DEU39_2989 [Chryseobacterium sp. AG363]